MGQIDGGATSEGSAVQPRDAADGQPESGGDERDHAATQRDVASAQRDEAGAQRDAAADRRDEVGARRDQGGNQRDRAGDRRDAAADLRDDAAGQRDEAADERDQVADDRDQAGDRCTVPVGDRITADALNRSEVARRQAAGDRRRAWQDRRAGAKERSRSEQDRDTASADRGAGADERNLASLDRSTALADRAAGASERTGAEHERDAASADRRDSAQDRDYASLDGLTGVYSRTAGLVELQREIARTKRSGQPLVVAFLDVDHLKAVNDASGHAAGDQLLVEIANTVRTELRSYDLIIRYGGDEFICVIPGLDTAAATKRFSMVNAVLARASAHGSVTAGIAELQTGDTLKSVIARADAALYRERQQQPTPSGGTP